MRTRLGRSNFAQLVKAATAPAAVAGACVGCWGLAAAWMIARGLPFTATDDFPRLIHAMAWARDPFFTPNRDTYWLPVPYLVQGLGCRFLQPLAGFYWYAWLSAGFMAAGCAAAIAAGRLVMGKGTDPGARLRVVLATLALLGSVPVAWRLAASGMSEPIYLAWQGLMIWAMVGARVRPTRGRWALLLIAGVLYQATRYEGWPLAIAAWVLAHGWSSWQDRRDRVRLALGILVLAAWPVFWMGYNASVAGDPLHFLRWARLMAAQRPELAEASLGHRVAFLSLTAWRQGWPIVLLLPWAAVRAWRGAGGRAALGLGLVAGAVYYQAAFSNTIGTALPDRFCLGALWIFAVVVAGAVAELRPARRAVWATALLGFVALMRAVAADNRDWGGLPMTDVEVQQLEKMRRLAAEGYTMVVEQRAEAESIANLLRVYAGLDRVRFLDEFSPQRPTPGRFVYFFRDIGYPAPEGSQYAFGHWYFLVDRIPPPPDILARIERSRQRR